jgi:hypothetical protein
MVSGEAPKLLERVLKAPQRIVEHTGQLSEFVPRVRDRQPVRERFSSDPPCRRRHRADRREETAREKVAARLTEQSGTRQWRMAERASS